MRKSGSGTMHFIARAFPAFRVDLHLQVPLQLFQIELLQEWYLSIPSGEKPAPRWEQC